jgi:hypothetical protein
VGVRGGGEGWGVPLKAPRLSVRRDILYRYIMFGRGISEKYQSSDEKFPEPNIIVLSGYIYYIITSYVNKGLSW